MSKTYLGYLLIADITRYTLYLSKSELEHAGEILSSLLTLIVENTRPPLVISRLAGDAVISYGLQDHFIHGQTFVEMIEATYVAFRKSIEQMVLNNLCSCNACKNVSTLDMKFFVHYGTFAIQKIGGHDELVGSDVNLIHRLLKNHAAEATGIEAYTLYTDAAVQQLGLQGALETMIALTEDYEHLGVVKVWLQDMHKVWAEKRETARTQIPEEQINIRFETDLGLKPEQVWDYLMKIEFRSVLLGADQVVVINRVSGRVAPGTVYQCLHGDKITRQLVLEWQPFERIVTRDMLPVKDTYVLVEHRLEPTRGGTRLIRSISRASGPLFLRVLMNLMMRRMVKGWQANLEVFRELIEADYAVRTAGFEPAHPAQHKTLRQPAGDQSPSYDQTS